jgi:ssDNA-binding Zn-finger/Zn-ribbon topoisomerase 1
MVRTIWSFCYVCPSCSYNLIYFEHLTNNRRDQPRKCPQCGEPFVRRSWNRSNDVPVRVVCAGIDGKLIEQPLSQADVDTIAQATRDRRQSKVPSLDIDPAREMYKRSALSKHGLTDTRSFFSPRNSIALLELWSAINQIDDAGIRQKLRFAFTAILPRASRRYQWGPLRPLNAQNQTYYIAPVYFEWNVFELFNRKVEAALRSDREVFHGPSLFNEAASHDFQYDLASADCLRHLPAASADYVFTDPPFGSNIFYSDMNLFQEAWLGETTENASEAVMHTTGKRKNGAADRYEALLRGAFEEAYRILKPGAHMSVVFGNSNGVIWGLVQRALRSAGFNSVPVHVAILDKGQRSVKGLNSGSEGVVTVDLILTVQKPSRSKASRSSNEPKQCHPDEVLAPALSSLPAEKALNPSYVYAATVREAIRRHLAVDNLHLSDVLIALRNAGYVVDSKTGLLDKPVSAKVLNSNGSTAGRTKP